MYKRFVRRYLVCSLILIGMVLSSPVHGYRIDFTFPGEYCCASEIRRAYKTELPNFNI